MRLKRETNPVIKKGLFFEKAGMTQIFNKFGLVVPVTVLKLLKHKVVDNERAIVFVEKRICMKKPQIDLLKSKDIEGAGMLRHIDPTITFDYFKEGDKVFASARSIGHGFSGVMKRWNFKGGRKSHGCSLSHRSGGSTGQRQDPGRTAKNKKMAGRWGFDNVTIENLSIVEKDLENGLLLIKGSVPGRVGGTVFLKQSPKKKGHI